MQNLNNIQREIIYLDVEKIHPNPYQPRRIFEENSIEDLSASIEAYGVIEPILVRDIKGVFYELIAGERRLKACKKIGIAKIPAIITNINKKDSACMALIENVQREKLNFIEEAEGFQTLMVDFGYTQEEIAKIIGKKQSTISNKLRLLKLKNDIKNTIIQNNLTERHARALLKLDNEKTQKEVLEKILKYDLNVQKTEELIENTIKKMSGQSLKTDKKIKGYIGDLRIFTNTIKNAVETMQDSGVNTNYSVVKKENGYEINIKVCTN
ncbi:nucleoid occlusion protein [[Clostridium] colinum]|uniref:nucleoid occlusion protein n=1 Tax=[Clostridium] colinum TaxID=36835 RepID=UPI0020250C7B|nr:nucleoid occlusion protein [[Clostridium] colinum]